MEEWHWYLFTFLHVGDVGTTYTSISLKTHTKKINIDMMTAAKKLAKVPSDSAIMSISYLGRMSEDEFNFAESAD